MKILQGMSEQGHGHKMLEVTNVLGSTRQDLEGSALVKQFPSFREGVLERLTLSYICNILNVYMYTLIRFYTLFLTSGHSNGGPKAMCFLLNIRCKRVKCLSATYLHLGTHKP